MTAPFIRENGFYWVRFHKFPHAKLTVGQWGGSWAFAGAMLSRKDSEIEVCGARIVLAGERENDDDTAYLHDKVGRGAELKPRAARLPDVVTPLERYDHSSLLKSALKSDALPAAVAAPADQGVVLEEPPAEPTTTFTFDEVVTLRTQARANGYRQAIYAAARVAEEEKNNTDHPVTCSTTAERRDGAVEAADNIAANIRNLLQKKEIQA